MVKPSRKPRSADELRTISNRLFYEWQMLTELAHALGTNVVNDKLVKNAFIESAAIHGRTLKKFLYADDGGNLQDTDAIAEDFFSNRRNEWYAARPERPSALEYNTFGIFADLQIAHLIYSDTKGKGIIDQGHKDWDFTEVADAIQPAIEKFISLVQREQLGDRWWKQLNDQSGLRWDKIKRQIAAKPTQHAISNYDYG